MSESSALEALEARPAKPLRALTSAVLWLGGREAPARHVSTGAGYRAAEIVADAPHDTAFPDVAREADALGFRYVGTKREGLTPIGIVSDVWTAPDETAYLSGTQARSRDPVVRGLSRYFDSTYFDDGTCVETTARKDSPLETTSELVIVRGTGSLSADWDAHRAAVEKHQARRGCHVIPVRDHATMLRLVRVHFRLLMPLPAAKTILSMFVIMSLAFFSFVALLLRAFFRP